MPELASRDHQKNILPVIDLALKKADLELHHVNAIAVTLGPGLSGSLLVGLSFAKSLALALHIPLIEVNHMQAHILAHFIKENNVNESNDIKNKIPHFPFLCLTVSGGHTQIVKISSVNQFELLAETEDDAIGEAFDKAAKILGLPYPGGPFINKFALLGNPKAFKFPTPQLKNNNYSFSGVKTSFLYLIKNSVDENPNFISDNLNDICASYQHHLINYLLKNLTIVSKETNIKQIAIAGGVSANSELREQLASLGKQHNWETFIPKMEYCTDNAAMIAMAGYFKFLENQFCELDVIPLPRYGI